MTQFKKYLMHFSLISLIIFSILSTLCFYGNEEIKWWFPIITFFSIWMIYSIPMAYKYSKMNAITSIELNSNNNSLLNEIDKIVLNKTKRKNKQLEDGKIIYSTKNKYTNWLTNSIIVNHHNDKITISLPKEFIKEFECLSKI